MGNRQLAMSGYVTKSSRPPEDGRAGSLSFSQMAAAYAPELCDRAARRRLTSWLRINPQLMKRLQETGFKEKQRVLTPRQVEIIYEFLGEP